MTTMRGVPFVAAILAGLFFIAAPAKPALAAAGSCQPNALNYKSVAGLAQTTSISYVEVPSSKTTFKHGAQSCVVATFSAQASTAGGEYLFVQAVLDGSLTCTPADSIFVFDSVATAAHTMTYVCPSVAAGKHTLSMQFRSSGGTVVHLSDRTLTVQYVK